MFCGISIVTSKGQLRHTPEIVVMEFQKNGFSDDCLQELSVQHQKHISTTTVIASSWSVPDTYNFTDYTTSYLLCALDTHVFCGHVHFCAGLSVPTVFHLYWVHVQARIDSSEQYTSFPNSIFILHNQHRILWRFPAMRVSPISPNHPFYFRMETLIIFTHHREMPTVAATCPGPRNSTLLS